jgi:RNA polymerase sigma factor (sigma-70 family)
VTSGGTRRGLRAPIRRARLPLLAFLHYRTGDRTLAEDILADTFERVLTARRFVPRGESEKTWLYTIALNRLRDLARRKGAERRALERVDAPARVPGDDREFRHVEQRNLVRRALSALPEDEREALSLRYGADLSLSEIAEVTGQKQTTVEGRIYRGLRRMRELMGSARLRGASHGP